MKFDATLKRMGFKQSAKEAAVYRRGRTQRYVDDLIITSVEEQKVEVFKAQMKKRST